MSVIIPLNYIYLGDKLIAKDGVQVPPSNSRKHYTPYGETIEAPKDDVGYTGHKFDTDLGLSYMQARYYDPVIGRFYSNDPVGFKADDLTTFNRYSYVGNNPYAYTDPDGKARKSKRMRGLAAANIVARVVKESTEEGSALNKYASSVVETTQTAMSGKSRLKSNVAQGKKGEAMTREKLGDNIAGEQVTFKTSDGTRTRPDFVTKDNQVVETKTGNAKLSTGQQKLKNDIDAGNHVTPVGKNAENAGLTPNEPVKMSGCNIDHPC